MTTTKQTKCPKCGKVVKIVGRYKNGDRILAQHSPPGWKGSLCDRVFAKPETSLGGCS